MLCPLPRGKSIHFSRLPAANALKATVHWGRGGGLISNCMNLNVLENNKREKGNHHTEWGKPSRTPEQGLPKTQVASVQNDFTAASLPSLSSIHSYALTSQGGCCPRVRTDAGWECRAQLGPTAAVYLIKT